MSSPQARFGWPGWLRRRPAGLAAGALILLALLAAYVGMILAANPAAGPGGVAAVLLPVAILAGIYAILAVSLNLTVGFTGMLNLGHAAFFGIGAYTAALLTKSLGWPFLPAFLAAGILAAIAGILIGIPSLHLRGDYFAIATLGFGEIIRALLKNWQGLTRGPLGIPGIPKPSLGISFASPVAFFFLTFAAALLAFWLVHRIIHSPFGRILRAIREDELAAEALGKNTRAYKITALALGAFFASWAGSLFAHHITFIDPSSFTFTETVVILSMVILGGLASNAGSVLGAGIIVLFLELVRFFEFPTFIEAGLRQLIFALLLILLMLFHPRGLVGERRLTLKLEGEP